MIQGLQLWRVGREEKPVPAKGQADDRMAAAERDLSARWNPALSTRDEGLSSTGLRPLHQDITQGAEGETVPAICVPLDRRTGAPLRGGKGTFAIRARGRDLPLLASARLAAGQGGQQGRVRFVLDV